MRFLTTLLIGSVLALPAMAQTTAPATPDSAPAATAPAHGTMHKPMHKAMRHHTVARTGSPGHPTATDKGPFTPAADRAYDGGGAILEGQPGGPPPPASAVLQQKPGQPLP